MGEDAVAGFRYFDIYAEPQKPGRKTRDYRVVNKSSGDDIGRIEFYPAWRRYVLSPEAGTVWSAGCLADVWGFIDRLKRGASCG